MKLSVNRNIVWCDVFAQRLFELGVRHVCISPGSRSTPLTLAFASNKNFKTYAVVDERSSAFFALGLAKKNNSPVVIVTTSGTAVAELYPAIIEAYYQRVPLIVCTADRPPALRTRGANQTINQHNIFKNHIRFFSDPGLPAIKKLSSVKKLAETAFRYSCISDRGPVHINFPFEKPFEPKSFTDKIDVGTIEKVFSNSSFELEPRKQAKINFELLSKKFTRTERGLIILGYNNYEKYFLQRLVTFSKKFGYPVYIDGASSLRFGPYSKENVIDNLTALVRSKYFLKHYDPELIIQFGGAPTSNILLEFFKESKSEKILINQFGDKNDPSFTAKQFLSICPVEFCDTILKITKNHNAKKNEWLDQLKKTNQLASTIKHELVEEAPFLFEGRIITELLKGLPEKSTLMISNSLPIRDTDFFSSSVNKQINVFTNRGASGIDGITSTALGIAKTSKEPTYLLIGDLAFFHDLNGLYTAQKYKIPLTIILINNNGGGIFESLPISKYKKYFRENFVMPLNIDFAKLVEAYGGNFFRVESWNEFHKQIKDSPKNKKFTVLEIKTDAKKSKLQRQKYWQAVANKVDSYINETKN